METYKVHVAGLERELPLCAVSNELSIAAFVMFGDTEVTKAASLELLAKVPDFDLLVTAEAKGIPLCYEMAVQSGKPYVVVRKALKIYMINPVMIQVKSITTNRIQDLYISEMEINQIKGRRILIVDDVISTGSSISAISQLVNDAGGNIVAKACVFTEGVAEHRTDVISLGHIPLFRK